jgi:hypothetical protein
MINRSLRFEDRTRDFDFVISFPDIQIEVRKHLMLWNKMKSILVNVTWHHRVVGFHDAGWKP